ncbi:hypothetical protein ACP0HM_10175 [Escherichia coli]
MHTQLAANAGALKAGGMVASMDQGGSPTPVTDLGFLPAKIFPVSLLSVQFI